MKKALIIGVVSTVIAVGSYLLYKKIQGSGEANLWESVSDNAVLVYESDNIVASWNRVMTTPLWNGVETIPAFDKIRTNLELLDSLSGRSGSLDRLLRDNLLSMHVTGKNTFDFVFYINLGNKEAKAIASKILSQIKSDSTITYGTRVYQGVTISEVGYKEQMFSYIIDNKAFIGSFTSFLVEDAVRLHNEEGHTFAKAHSTLFDMPKLAKDDGNVYLNIEKVALLFSSFLKSDEKGVIKPINSLSRSSFLDLSFTDNKVLMNGFSKPATEYDFLSTFQAQRPVSGNLKYLIPNNTYSLIDYALSDAAPFHQSLIKYWGVNVPKFLKSREEFSDKYGFDFDKMYQWIGKDIAIANLETPGIDGGDKLVFVEAHDVNEGLNQLNTFMESVARANGDSVYLEHFSNYEIRELKVNDFPQYAFGSLFSGFEESYYTLSGEYIIFSNTIQALKSFIIDLEAENTWGRSVIYNQFLESNLEEANLNIIFNTSKIWDKLLGKLDPFWQVFFSEHAAQLKGFSLGSVQFSKLDNNFYTSVALQYDQRKPIPEKQNFNILQNVAFTNDLIIKPYIVHNHLNNTLEVVLQDTANNLYLVDKSAEVLWSHRLTDPVISEIQQVDYYKNNKLQYFFVTKDALHIIDRLGNEVDGFPVMLDGIRVKYANVIDYDKSKRYRYLIADEMGDLYLFDKEGKPLEGWSPRKLTGKLASSPFHIRVRGRDFMIAIQQNGVVNVMNRRGEAVPGFPLNLETDVSGEPFIKVGSDFDKTTFTVVSREGKVLNFNLSGKIISTEQLYKPTKESRFSIVPDALGKTYIVARQDNGRLVLLDARNNEVIAKDYLTSQKMSIQYYNFGSDNQIYAITDKVQGFTYLYNHEGLLINARPLDSEQEIAIIYSEISNTYKLYSVSGKTFKILTF